MKMVLKMKATVHILVRVLQLKRLGPFDSNFAHTFKNSNVAKKCAKIKKSLTKRNKTSDGN